jgi:hypothetical protein
VLSVCKQSAKTEYEVNLSLSKSTGHDFSIENIAISQYQKKDLQYTLDVTCYAIQRNFGRHEALKLNCAEADPGI